MPDNDNRNLVAIRQYLKDNDNRTSLTTQQADMLEKYRITYSLFLENKTKRRTADVLIKYFNGISRGTAYSYLHAAEVLFGSVEDANNQMKRQIASEMAIEIYEKAKASRNLDQMNKALANYIKANGLHIEESDLPDWSKIQPQQDVLQISPEFLELYADKVDSKVLEKVKELFKVSKIDQYLEDVIDVDFLEVEKKKDE